MLDWGVVAFILLALEAVQGADRFTGYLREPLRGSGQDALDQRKNGSQDAACYGHDPQVLSICCPLWSLLD